MRVPAPIPVRPSGWRWRVAQAVLWLLYGRKYHDVSPWKNAGVACAGIFHHHGKVLLALRAGAVEHAGCYGLIGGFLDCAASEDLGPALAREVREECGVQVNAAAFTRHNVRTAYMWHGREMHEKKDYSTLCLFWWYEMAEAEIQSLQTLDETAGFIWVNAPQFEEMVAAGQIPFRDTQCAVRDFFAEATTR
ncbi:MAG: NUDIX hydrolase [Alphaproteobacteria bacterium]